MPEHVSDEGDHAEAGERYAAAPSTLDQPAAACSPGEGSFQDPTSGQQDRTALLLCQFDDMQRKAVGIGTDLVVGLLIMLLFGMVGVMRYAYGPGYAEAMLIVSAVSISIRLLLDRRRLEDPPSTG